MEEEEMLRVQIAVAKKSNCQSRPSSVDIYKRKVDSVKQKYEDQLKEMTEELAALKQEESNFYLDIATNLGKGAAERDTKPKALVTETQCSINMSDVSTSLICKALGSCLSHGYDQLQDLQHSHWPDWSFPASRKSCHAPHGSQLHIQILKVHPHPDECCSK